MRTAAKKTAIKKSGTKSTVKGGYTKKKVNNTEIFTVIEGLPMVRMKTSEEERDTIRKAINQLIPNKNHIMLPIRFKGSALKIADVEYPQNKFRTSRSKYKDYFCLWITA